MGDLTRNLSRHEFACKCGCGFDTVDIILAQMLQAATNHFSQLHGDCRIDITGGTRCKKHNDDLRLLYQSSNGKKGALTARQSQHIYGRAADFKITVRSTNKPIPPQDIHEWLDEEYGNKISLGLYVNRVHADSRSNGGARWPKEG